MNTKERKAKRKQQQALLLELENLIKTNGNGKRIEEIRQVLNSSPATLTIKNKEEVTFPITFEQYLKLRIFKLTDMQIRDVYDLGKAELVRFKMSHGLYTAADLKKKINEYILQTS